MKKALILLTVLAASATAAKPRLEEWLYNCCGVTKEVGGMDVLVDVTALQKTTSDVFVYSEGIPSHDLGPWGNPNVASPQDYTFAIPRIPSPDATPDETPLGPIGVFVNGVPMFNAKDGFHWTPGGPVQGGGAWNQNAIVTEWATFDGCVGHPEDMGRYHYHTVPACLQDQLFDGGVAHSPIIGWAFDGYPLYGPYGYEDPSDASSAVVRVTSSWVKKAGERPPGAPKIADYARGYFVEDFEYIAGSGDLDRHNCRWTITPEFPSGTYAYFATVDGAGAPEYPYLLGPRYFGQPETDNYDGGPDPDDTGATPHDPCPPDPVNYCMTSPNSVGAGALIDWSGGTCIVHNDFELRVTGCPPNVPGLFFYGGSQQQIPLGNGNVCIGAGGIGIHRLPVVVIDGIGDGEHLVDLYAPESAITAGIEVNFQFWYRDPLGGGALFNFSDGLSAEFY